MISLTRTLVHPIDDNSPLDRFSVEDIAAASGEIIIVIEGSDDILSQNVFARTSYMADDTIENARFEDFTYTDEKTIF